MMNRGLSYFLVLMQKFTKYESRCWVIRKFQSGGTFYGTLKFWWLFRGVKLDNYQILWASCYIFCHRCFSKISLLRSFYPWRHVFFY